MKPAGAVVRACAAGFLFQGGCSEERPAVVDLTPPAVPWRESGKYEISVRVVSGTVSDVFVVVAGVRSKMQPSNRWPRVLEHSVALRTSDSEFTYATEVWVAGGVARGPPRRVLIVAPIVR